MDDFTKNEIRQLITSFILDETLKYSKLTELELDKREYIESKTTSQRLHNLLNQIDELCEATIRDSNNK